MVRRKTKLSANLEALARAIAGQRRRISDHVAAFFMLTGIGVAGWLWDSQEGNAIVASLGLWLATFLVIVIIVAGGHDQ